MKYLAIEHPLRIRYDEVGDGHWHAPRDGRLHEGEDILFTPGDIILAWDLMKVVKHGWCYDEDRRFRYVHVALQDCEWRLLYTTLAPNLKIGDWIPTGTALCIVQDISLRYPSALPHVHLERYIGDRKVNPGVGE